MEHERNTDFLQETEDKWYQWPLCLAQRSPTFKGNGQEQEVVEKNYYDYPWCSESSQNSKNTKRVSLVKTQFVTKPDLNLLKAVYCLYLSNRNILKFHLKKN